MQRIRIQWRAEHERPILAVDYRELSSSGELLALLEQQLRVERGCATSMLVLVDFRQTRLGADFLTRAKLLGSGRQATVAKTAILCSTDLHHILLQEYIFATGDHAVRAFTDEQPALRWLLQ